MKRVRQEGATGEAGEGGWPVTDGLECHIKKYILRKSGGDSLQDFRQDVMLQGVCSREPACLSCSVERAGGGDEEERLEARRLVRRPLC